MIIKMGVGIESTKYSWDFLMLRVLIFTINIKVGDFFNVVPDIFKVNKVANKNLKEAKKLIKLHGYKKNLVKSVFSIYGDLRPLAVEAGFGKWSENGLITNEKYGTNF